MPVPHNRNKKHYRVTTLPKVTREEALEKDPDLAWVRNPSTEPLLTRENASIVSNLQYEGRAGG